MNNDQNKNKANQNQGQMKPDANKQGTPQQPMKSPAGKQDIAGGNDRDLQSTGTGKLGQGQSGSKVGKDIDVDQADRVAQRQTGGGSDVDDLDDDLDLDDKNASSVKTPPTRR